MLLRSPIQPISRPVSARPRLPSILQQALSILRRPGIEAHVYLPGGTQTNYGVELVDGTTWSTAAEIVASGQSLVFTAAPASSSANNTSGGTMAASKTYRVTYDVSGYSSGSFYVQSGSGGYTGQTRAANGSYSEHITPTGTTTPTFKAASVGSTFTVSNISVKEVITTSVVLSGLQAANYLLSDGSTGNTTVDGVTGLVLDAMGSVGAELVVSPFTLGDAASIITNSAVLRVENGDASAAYTAPNASVVIGKTYEITCNLITKPASSSARFLFGGSDTGATLVAGPIRRIFTASTTSGLQLTNGSSAVLSEYSEWGSISVREVTGIHATQPTTMAKPRLERGVRNLHLWSHDLTNAAYSTTAVTVVQVAAAQRLVPTAVPADHAKNITTAAITSGAAYTLAFLAKASGYSYCAIGTVGAGTGYSFFNLTTGLVGTKLAAHTNTEMLAIGDGIYLCVANVVASATAINQYNLVTAIENVANSTGDGVSGVEFSGTALFQGTLTAAQILAEGGIPLTTTAAASNPSAGKYSWAFDGNDSLALGSVPFQQADDFFMIAGVRADVVSTTPDVFSQASTASTNPLIKIGFNTAGKVTFAVRDDAGALVVLSDPGISQQGVTCVFSGRKVGNEKTLKLNGSQVAVDSTPVGATTFTGASIGVRPLLTPGNYLTGSTGPIIAGKGTLTASEILTLERFVAQLTPNAPSF